MWFPCSLLCATACFHFAPFFFFFQQAILTMFNNQMPFGFWFFCKTFYVNSIRKVVFVSSHILVWLLDRCEGVPPSPPDFGVGPVCLSLDSAIDWQHSFQKNSFISCLSKHSSNGGTGLIWQKIVKSLCEWVPPLQECMGEAAAHPLQSCPCQ